MTVHMVSVHMLNVQGSAEAVRDSVMGLAGSEVGVKVVLEGVGPVTTTDIDTARATGACILAFNVKYANAAVEGVAKVQAVKVVEHRIIYRMLEEVSALLACTMPAKACHTTWGGAMLNHCCSSVHGKKTGRPCSLVARGSPCCLSCCTVHMHR